MSSTSVPKPERDLLKTLRRCARWQISSFSGGPKAQGSGSQDSPLLHCPSLISFQTFSSPFGFSFLNYLPAPKHVQHHSGGHFKDAFKTCEISRCFLLAGAYKPKFSFWLLQGWFQPPTHMPTFPGMACARSYSTAGSFQVETSVEYSHFWSFWRVTIQWRAVRLFFRIQVLTLGMFPREKR